MEPALNSFLLSICQCHAYGSSVCCWKAHEESDFLGGMIPKASLTIAFWYLGSVGEVQLSLKVSSEQSKMLLLSHYKILKVLHSTELSTA